MEERRVLVVGLGNPGSSYETTRHNIGHVIVTAFAKDHGFVLQNNPGLKAKVAVGHIDGTEVHFLLPTTFMNNSGLAIERARQLFAIDVSSILVIVDDICIDFGRFRLREKGSAGGHNGLKSVEAHLLSQEYQRLKIGIGDRFIGSLEEYVLSNFTGAELDQMPEVITHAKAVIHLWIAGDIKQAQEMAGKVSLNTQGENE